MAKMVHGRIVTGETTVVSMAAVLQCGKQMKKLTFPGQPLSKNRGKV
jgi:hypothetical protein